MARIMLSLGGNGPTPSEASASAGTTMGESAKTMSAPASSVGSPLLRSSHARGSRSPSQVTSSPVGIIFRICLNSHARRSPLGSSVTARRACCMRSAIAPTARHQTSGNTASSATVSARGPAAHCGSLRPSSSEGDHHVTAPSHAAAAPPAAGSRHVAVAGHQTHLAHAADSAPAHTHIGQLVPVWSAHPSPFTAVAAAMHAQTSTSARIRPRAATMSPRTCSRTTPRTESPSAARRRFPSRAGPAHA
mmetsp:Transcript_19725/g.69850  ORF Transcript_19725/g.69850 Transcript_19725/m.69850 type:complete len:248 (+) Transcript_19725:2544-3287(+)